MSNILYIKGVGIASALFLSGAFFSASHLTIPTLYGLDPALTTSVFSKLYYRGLASLVPIVVLSTTCSAYLAYSIPVRRNTYLAAAAGPLATLPFTTLVMAGTIDTLLGLAKQEDERNRVGAQGVDTLLMRWAGMNLVRSAMAFVGGVAGLWTTL